MIRQQLGIFGWNDADESTGSELKDKRVFRRGIPQIASAQHQA